MIVVLSWRAADSLLSVSALWHPQGDSAMTAADVHSVPLTVAIKREPGRSMIDVVGHGIGEAVLAHLMFAQLTLCSCHGSCRSNRGRRGRWRVRSHSGALGCRPLA